MSAPLIWLVLGLLLIGAEMLSGDFFLLMLGVGGLGAAGASAFGAGPLVSAIVFAVVSLLLLLGVRPIAKRRLQAGVRLVPSNTEKLLGARAVALTEVGQHEHGRVKIGGDTWSARTEDGAEVIAEGERVRVVEISGATAVVTAL